MGPAALTTRDPCARTARVGVSFLGGYFFAWRAWATALKEMHGTSWCLQPCWVSLGTFDND